MAQDFSVFPSMNFVDLGLYQFGREYCEPAHSYGPAIRNHYLFHYILSGKGTFMWQDGKRRENKQFSKPGRDFSSPPGRSQHMLPMTVSPGNTAGWNLTASEPKGPWRSPVSPSTTRSTIPFTANLRRKCATRCSTSFATKKRRRSI